MKHPSVIHAAAVALLAVVLLIFVCAPIQSSLGMAGLALTELIILALAVISAVVIGRMTGEPPKGFFPIKAVPPRQLLGSLFIYIGGYFAMYAAATALAYLFPDAVAGEADYLSGVISSVPPLLSLLITAVMPAVCEEALHRGVILRCVGGTAERAFTQERTIAASVFVTVAGGALFGLHHLDPYRFITTAVLGGALSYICFKTGSMLPGMILHFINNAMSVAALFIESSVRTAPAMTPEQQQAFDALLAEAEKMAASPRAVFGTALIMLGWAVIFLRAGQRLMKPKIRYELPDNPTDEDFERLSLEINARRNPVAPDGTRYAPSWLKSLAIVLTVLALFTLGSALTASAAGGYASALGGLGI
ncbi:MAG: CPBP family intramembrane metalloprotease [Clostridia bacterium]|nr:CPBP family intramembrane metalloprotease [Clostridia bacterium]